jgi:hypothetical protein
MKHPDATKGVKFHVAAPDDDQSSGCVSYDAYLSLMTRRLGGRQERASAGRRAARQSADFSGNGTQLLAKGQWVPDSASGACRLCEKEFSCWTRRHHCRHCGELLCADCSRCQGRGARGEGRAGGWVGWRLVAREPCSLLLG